MRNQDTTVPKKTPLLVHAGMATLLLCVATVGYTHHMPDFGRFFAGTNDFLLFYTQARMVGTGQMYDIEAGYREQERTVGLHLTGAYHDAIISYRMPWQALLMAPLGRLPYPQAYWIWIALHLVCFAAFVCIWLAPRDCVLWGATFFPLAASIIVGQDALLLALCLAGVLRLAERRQDLTAGFLLALCTAKPHLFLLVPLALAAHRRWRIVLGAVLGSLVLSILGMAAAGPEWPRRWLTILTTVGEQSGPDVATRPSVFQFGMNEATVGIAVALAVAFGVLVWRSRELEAGVAIAVIGSILIAPHTHIYDLPLLLVALPALPLPGHAHWLRIALLTPIPYWALLSTAPWNALLPLMLLAAVGVSAYLANPFASRSRAASGLPG
jgi:hypothetical protein